MMGSFKRHKKGALKAPQFTVLTIHGLLFTAH